MKYLERTQLRPTCGSATGYRTHEKNHEKLCANCLEYRRASWRKWYENNSDRERERFKKNKQERQQYRVSHEISKQKNQRKRRAARNAAEHVPYTEYDIIKKWGHKCHICLEPIDLKAPRRAGSSEGWERGLHLDHVVAIINGGSDTPENVKPSHALCNLQKAAKYHEES